MFTKVLAPYGRYLGYWKSNELFYGGLIDVHLNLSDGTIVGENIEARNTRIPMGALFFDEDDDSDDDLEEDECFLKPIYTRTKSFTIDTKSNSIICHHCNDSLTELPWIKNFDTNNKYFGLSHEALPANERSLLVTHDHDHTDIPEQNDVYFVRTCAAVAFVFHPFSVPKPLISEDAHPLSRLNGVWVGSYGGHGLELLYVEICHNFTCPITIDGGSKESEIVPIALVGRKITGDPNVPHSKISFAVTHLIQADSDTPSYYEGVGQSKKLFIMY